MILDPQQTAAVQTASARALVLAGPGSGKTRVIVERAAWLIEEQRVSPYELLLVTFTRKAAGEMRERLEARCGHAARGVTIGTFHGVALQLLHRFGDLIGFKPDKLTVYGEFETNYLLRECAVDLGILRGKTWKIPKGVIVAAFERYYQTGEEPEEDHPARTIFVEFVRRCKENNSATYGSLLTGFKLLLPMIEQYLHWRHIIVDECHDTDRLQWNLIENLHVKLKASLFVVADNDQSIYSFRGAVPEYLLEHQDSFDILRLENNYRSVPEIVEAADRLIQHNTERLPKTMRAMRDDNPDSGITSWTGMRAYGGMNSKLIAETIYSDLPFNSSTAILSRNHFLLDRLSEELTALEIPHTKVGRTGKLIESEAFRRFHAFLKLMCNPYDNFSMLLIRDLLGLSREEYNRIRLQATQEAKSHFQVWMGMDDPSNPETWQKWYACHLMATTIIEQLAGFECWENNEAINNVAQFGCAWFFDHPNSGMEEYLDWLATWDVQDELRDDDDKLKLMTIHAAKGLEFPLVILIGCNEGLLPSKQSIAKEDIQEERRLMYVAMTRAKDALVLAVRPERQEKNDRVYENPKSRFLEEIK